MSLNEQAENIRRSIEFIRNGSLGIVTDGDKYKRPFLSMKELRNMDYDNEVNMLSTKNDTNAGDFFAGLEFPHDHDVMEGGCRTFSFNAPVDRQVKILFLKHRENGNVKIYVNTWYNPPALSVTENYENYVSSKTADTWHPEWIEITESILLNNFVKTGSLTFTANNGIVSANHHRGWFAWNATKWNTGDTDKIKNESFTCIESYDGANTFVIQDRPDLNLTQLGWNTGDVIYLVRYPTLVQKAVSTVLANIDLNLNFTVYGQDWLLKTNTSVKALIGQEGNLWFGFVNKDTVEVPAIRTGTERQNINKRYGWWLDYEQIPVMVKRDGFSFNAVAYDLIFNSKIGLRLNLVYTVGFALPTYSQLFGVSLTLDGIQTIAILLSSVPSVTANYYLNYRFRPYHHYSRRFTAMQVYATKDAQPIDTPNTIYNRVIGQVYRQPDTATPYWYSFYHFGSTLTPPPNFIAFVVDMDRQDGSNLESTIGYTATKKIYTADKFGALLKDVILTAGDSEKPDRVSPSLIQGGVVSEDIFSIDKRFSVGGADKDRLMHIITRDKIAYCVKNNSIHKYVMRNDGSGFNYIGEMTKIGTKYPRTIIATPLGIMFANDSGIWLVSDGQEINILSQTRLDEYATIDKSLIFAVWYEHKKEAWFYVGNQTIWILKHTQRTRGLGWRDYTVPYQVTDFFVDEDSFLWLVNPTGVFKLYHDEEENNGSDNTMRISWKFRENLMLLREQEQTRHRRWKPIEHKIYYEVEPRTDTTLPEHAEETVNYKIYVSDTEIYEEGVIKIRVNDGIMADFFSKRNVRAKSQKAFAIELSGTLTYCKKIKFSELFTRAILLGQPIKGGTIKPSMI